MNSCYKSRILLSLPKFCGNRAKKEEQLTKDGKIRQARKELEVAMEIFHHKLMRRKEKYGKILNEFKISYGLEKM